MLCIIWTYVERVKVTVISSPSRHSVGIPSGVDVNPADTHDLLRAARAVQVVLTENDAPRPTAVFFEKAMKRMIDGTSELTKSFTVNWTPVWLVEDLIKSWIPLLGVSYNWGSFC